MKLLNCICVTWVLGRGVVGGELAVVAWGQFGIGTLLGVGKAFGV